MRCWKAKPDGTVLKARFILCCLQTLLAWGSVTILRPKAGTSMHGNGESVLAFWVPQ